MVPPLPSLLLLEYRPPDRPRYRQSHNEPIGRVLLTELRGACRGTAQWRRGRAKAQGQSR
jgi:hypothetical protein